MSKNTSEIDTEQFVHTENPEARNQLLRQMSRNRSIIHAASKTAWFQAGLTKIESVAKNDNQPEQKLLAIDALARASVVKSLQSSLDKTLADILKTPIPSLQILKDANERYHVAKALLNCRSEWLASFVSDESVFEKTGEKVREELLNILVSRSTYLTALFEYLSSSIQKLKESENLVGDTMGRRLKRILHALRTIISTSAIEADDEVGYKFNTLINISFKKTGTPEDLQIRTQLAEEVIALIHEMVRIRFSQATDSQGYRSM